MNYIIVLFNLKEGVSAEAYEAWAAASDMPMVRGLPSIEGFDVFRLGTIRGSENPSPYQYVEMISINDMAHFGTDVSADAMKAVAAEFRQFADAPIFINAEKLGA